MNDWTSFQARSVHTRVRYDRNNKRLAGTLRLDDSTVIVNVVLMHSLPLLRQVGSCDFTVL